VVRIGFGYDVHALTEGRKLALGGIIVPHHKGSLGHSDGDALIHAICDAMLGALSLGDIGQHFKDTDPAYKDIDSKILLRRTMELVNREGWSIGNIDSTVLLEKPKIMAYIDAMRTTLAEVLNIQPGQISVKATTNEKMGFVGREDGVAAYAIVLLQSAE